jgi:hypothetical protein
MHHLLHKSIPDMLRALTPGAEQYKIEGSDGGGFVTDVPWVAALHKEITDTARRGYYVVWLLPEDRKTLILELGLGATQFADLYGENKKALAASAGAAAKVAPVVRQHLATVFSERLRARAHLGELPPLGKSFEHKAYGSAAVVSVSYQLSSLPSGQELVEDYRSFVSLYARLVSSPLMPTTDELVMDVLATPGPIESVRPKITKVVDFVPSGKMSGGFGFRSEGNDAQSRRHSRVSKKIGDHGEQLVYQFLKSQLLLAGRPDLAERVIWHQESSTDRTPGWDITAYDSETGEVIFVEVKSSQSNSIGEVILTRNEWRAAQESGHRYLIYLVKNVLHMHPTVEVLRDPAKMVMDDLLFISEASWALRL